MRRPELGAVAGLILVTCFFFITADPVMFNLAGLVNFLTPAAQLGIMALGAALLMIGGEFDLSIGSMVAFSGLVFGASITMVTGIPVEILWFVVLTGLATWVLLRTPLGNWIFASGGDPVAAKNSGVPVRRVKVGLFVLAALCAALVAIITAVIGGGLLTGGYGLAIGAFLGAIIFGMVMIGLTYTRIDQDWYLVFLGGMLLVAVLFNNTIRKRVTGER